VTEGKDGGELGQGPRPDVLSDEKVEARARDLLPQMTLEEKVRALTLAPSWR
jgi:hypothetical protein